MDIKVVVEGVSRELCGVTESTSCEDIIFKLAQAASLPGFYTLVARRHRGGGEQTLSPDEKVVDFLRKIGEKASSVQFVLRRLETTSPRAGKTSSQQRRHDSSSRQSAGRSVVSRPGSNQPTSVNYSGGGSRIASSSNAPRRTTGDAPSYCYATSSRPVPSQGNVQQDSPSSSHQQLEDQLASQEQQVEFNRIRLLRLDKEIADFERQLRPTSSSSDYELAVGPAAELAQLASTPWPQLLSTNTQRQHALVGERQSHLAALDAVNGEIVRTQSEATQLENRVSHELNRLLADLESATNQHRRQAYPSSSSSPGAPQDPPAVGDGGGVPV